MGRKILFQFTGSIAAFKACALLSRLVKEGHEVQTVATRGALEFVGKATLEGLSGKPVFSDLYEPGRQMDHIHLAKWADLALVCPASASAINRLSAGLGEDALGTLFLAWDLKKPYWVAPAMNSRMLAHPATQASLGKLESYGVKILPTAAGDLACGDVGEGRLLEPEALYSELKQWLV
jgi:phosphopantothenoylcysteine decarboxylase/phosphopantothenate--cysteine ligase